MGLYSYKRIVVSALCLLVVLAAMLKPRSTTAVQEAIPMPMQGAFYNLTVQAGGTVAASLLSQTNTITGSINLTEYPGVTSVLCGAGDFSGPATPQPFALSFVSQDTDPHCGFDWGAVVTMTANLDPTASHFWGDYGIKTLANRW